MPDEKQWGTRELDMLRYMGEGISNSEGAAKMGITPNYARRIKQKVYANLGVHSAEDAIVAARSLGLLDDHTPTENSPREEESYTALVCDLESDWPERLTVLCDKQNRQVVFAKHKGHQGLACFTTERGVTMFQRFNARTAGCIPIEIGIADAEEMARKHGSERFSKLLLLDDLTKLVVREVG